METSNRWSSLGAIAEHAMALGAGCRSDYLDRACGADTGLRRRVEQLLAADRDAGSFLEVPAVDQLPDRQPTEPLAAANSGERIGPYRVLRPLGAGGVGEVFLVERADDQYQRRVAVKVLRHRLVADDAKRRILAERQILARLEHPHIARLYDGGTTEDGRPYIVMEYVDGVPIDSYCARRRLPLAARLELFKNLCSAVQSAHQNFVVHRDLKPSNILVTADGDLKLLDFSIAKVAVPDPDRLLVETATGNRPMTLSFASPEQIQGEAVTAATDVHGLGIVLYRMLTGRHPFPVEGKPLHAVVETMCDHEPIAPSRAVSRRAGEVDAGSEEAARRGGLPARCLAGDLDAIVLKALEKKPRDRYASAEQLAADLGRYQRRLPILARPHSLGYRLRKAASRYRALLLLLSVSSLLIAAFVVALMAQARRADAEARKAAIEAGRANREARSAAEMADFLAGVFSVFDPGVGRGSTVTARELLDQSLRQARLDLANQPASFGRILDTIGVAYHQLGLYDAAAATLEEALEVRTRAHGEGSLELAETLRHRATVLWTVGDLAPAEQVMSRALDISKASRESNDLAIAASLHGLGIVAWIQGHFERAERYNREALRIRSASLGGVHLDPTGGRPIEVAATMDNLAIVLHDRGKHDEAESFFLQSLALRRRLQRPDHPHVARTLGNLAALYSAQDRDREAEAHTVRAIDIWRDTYGDDYPRLGSLWINLGIIYLESGRLEEAEQALTESRRILAATLDPDHQWVAMATQRLAHLRLEQGRPREAEELILEAKTSLERNLGSAHPLVAESFEIYGRILDRLGRAVESKHCLVRAHETLLVSFADDHPDVRQFCQRHPAVCGVTRGDAEE